MSSTGLTNISVSELAVQNTILAGDDLDSGSLGQVLISGGNTGNVRWGSNSATLPNALTMGSNVFLSSGNSSFDGGIADTINAVDTDTTYTAGNGIQISGSNIIQTKTDNQTIRDSGGGSGNNLEVIKVPNSLTFTGYATGSFDGSSSLNINLVDTDTTYQGGTGINIDTTTTPDTINCKNIPNTALLNSTISGISLGSNLANLTFYDSNGGFITSYNGANPPTSITLDGDTTYQGGSNISIDTSTNPDTINLNSNLSNIDTISFRSTASPTVLLGNTYPSNPTPLLFCDLSSNTNVIPGGVLATKVQRTYLVKSFSNVYSEYSSNFRTSFKAQSANVMVDFRAVIISSNRFFYGGLYDYNAGAYIADTRNRFNYNDETDQDHTVMTWWIRNLTPGSTYYISPYFRGSSSTVYIFAGHSGTIDGFAPGIMRIYDGGNNVNIY